MKILLAIAVTLFALPATAQMSCGPTAALPAFLAQRFGEVLVAEDSAESASGVVVHFRLWHNAETGTWSLTGNIGDGMSCMIATGNPGKNPLNGREIPDLLNPASVRI